MAGPLTPNPAGGQAGFPQEAAAKLMQAAGLPDSVEWSPVRGGANNRVFSATTPNGKVLLKIYYQSESDGRDRFRGERCFYGLAQKAGLSSVPRALGWDPGGRLALFEFIEGRKLEAGEVAAGHVRAAARLVASVNETLDGAGDLGNQPVASEACFGFAQHLAAVQARVDRLCALPVHDDLDAEAAAWIHGELVPAWAEVRGEATVRAAQERLDAIEVLPQSQRWISPSDFGFHNALMEPTGTFRFFDFEYAGWDDPAKLAADFFCQPAVPVPVGLWNEFASGLAACHRWHPAAGTRARLLLPAYRVKWCCIMMNEFLAAEARRRYFSSSEMVDTRTAQLAKASAALRQTDQPT